MPLPENASMSFRGKQARWFAPVIGFFDLESLIVPVEGCQQDPKHSSTRSIEKHLPCSYALLCIEKDKADPYFFEIQQGPGIMKSFVETVQALAKKIHSDKRRFREYEGVPPFPKETATRCWICEIDMKPEDAVLDHCHFSGEFLGYAHNQCNLNRKSLNYTPIFAHNLSNYDMHHLVLALNNVETRNTISIIPNNDEKFIALQIGVYITTITDKKGVKKNIYEYIRFLDSFRFMGASLDNLVKNLPSDKFEFLEKHFEMWSSKEVNLFKQKRFFPYGYINSFEKLREPKLPAINEWKNSLDQFNVTINADEFIHAKRVFATFKCKNIGDYYRLYLTTDVFLLACVMTMFRNVCYETYGLDCTQYFTASNLSGDAMLKICRADLKLLTNRNHLDLVEQLMRGGVSSVYTKRLCRANNKYMGEDFDPSKPSTFIIMIDANNLYGGIMEKFALPMNNFELTDETNWGKSEHDELLSKILNTDDDSEIGYIVEVDLEYPDNLHTTHADFPLAPEKVAVQKTWLSDYQRELLIQCDVVRSTKSTKLLQTFFNKKRYTLHYQTLKLYVKLGMVVQKMYQVLSFRQGKWLAPYVQLNTNKRKQAANKFEQDFYKLMVNSSFGKTCEGKRNRIKVNLARSDEEALKLTEKPNFQSFKIIDEDMSTVSLRQDVILWDKPTIVGACILDLSKKFMFEFHHCIMKENFQCNLLYSDTDSFVYEIQSDDFYEEVQRKSDIMNLFDFSNFPQEHVLYSKDNEKVVLKFKDEMGGRIIVEFCGLKPKLYSIKLHSGSVKQSAKAVTRDARKNLTHELYKETLEKGNFVRMINTRIASSNHQLTTVVMNKKSLSAYDDKRYIQDDKISTLPYGHEQLRDSMCFQEIMDDPEWGLSEDDENDTPTMDNEQTSSSVQNRQDEMARTETSEFIGLRPMLYSIHQPSGKTTSTWTPPDPGFNQPVYSDTDLEDVIDFDCITDNEIDEPETDFVPCPFILDEAEEVADSQPSPERQTKNGIAAKQTVILVPDTPESQQGALLNTSSACNNSESSSPTPPLVIYETPEKDMPQPKPKKRALLDSSDDDDANKENVPPRQKKKTARVLFIKEY